MNTITNLFRSVSCGAFIAFLILVAPAGAADQSWIPSGAVWRYEYSGTDLGTAWRVVAYTDNGWLSGPAQLGYGDGDEATLLQASPVRSCYYFRHHFSVTDPALYSSLSLEVLVDDGCVVYLNGQEVGRYGMPTGTITYTTWASSAAEYTWIPATPIAKLLTAGENVVAVEVNSPGQLDAHRREF